MHWADQFENSFLNLSFKDINLDLQCQTLLIFQKQHEDFVQQLLQSIEETHSLREGLQETPQRVIKSWKELYAGYKQSPESILSKTFEAHNYSQMIICRDIAFYSTCEHHMLPFFGVAHIGYIPTTKVVGLSKLPRLVHCFARRLQLQEGLTEQIATSFEKHIQPEGVGVWIKAQHFCVMARGVSNHSSQMITTALKGSFLNDPKVRQEFLSSIAK